MFPKTLDFPPFSVNVSDVAAPPHAQLRSPKKVPRAPLTDLSIKRLPVPAVGTATHWDALKGFGVRVSASGARPFIVLIGSAGASQSQVPAHLAV